MDATDLRGRRPGCRVALDADAAEVSVWMANGDGPDWTCERVDVIEAFTDGTFDRARDEARGAGMALDAVEVVRDPRTVVSLTIATLVQVAMVHAGVPPMAAKLIGDMAGKLGRSLLADEADGDQGPAVCYVDFDYDDTGRIRGEEPEIQRADRVPRPSAAGELLDREETPRAARAQPVPRSRGTSPGTRSLPPDLGRLSGVAPIHNRESRGRGGRGGPAGPAGRGGLDGR